MQTQTRQQDHSSSIQHLTKITSNRYDYAKVIELIDRKGKDLYGLKFKLQKEDLQLILKLAAYFLRDEEFCAKENINLEK